MKPFLKFDYNNFNQKNLNKILSKFGDPKKSRILYLSTYKANYTRTETLLELFKKNKINFKTIFVEGSKIKYFKVIYNLIKYQKSYDIIFVAFRGHEILPFIKLLTRKPIIFDAFVSVYDTLCFDREIFKPNSFIGEFLKWYDKFLCRISKVVLVDTKEHKDYFEKEFDVNNIDYLYVGCNEDLFKPIETKKRESTFVVFWYGSANPLQGVNTILKSANLLEKNKNVQFRLVGPIREKYSKLIKNLKLGNIEFIDFIPYDKLPVEINKADLCLGGHFSNKDKAKRVIPGKTFQFISCNKPTIVADNPANRELFRETRHLSFIEPGSPEKLASKILEIKNGR